MTASLVVAVLMLAGKAVAYLLTHSVAILSDLLESVIHLAATGMAAFSLWYSKQPPDQEHPYGHGKIAYFSAGVEGALVLAAAIGIFFTAGHALLDKAEPKSMGLGAVIMAALAVINLLLGLFLVRVGKRENEIVLVANGHHVLSDMATNFGVIAGILIVWLTGQAWLDAGVALLVGIQVLVMGIFLMRSAFNGLMEKADPVKTDAIRKVLRRAVEEGRLSDWHQLRHRMVDNDLWIEVHLILKGEETVTEAHKVATALEDQIRALFPKENVRITTHIEPAGHDEDHPPGHPDHRDDRKEVYTS